MVMDGSQKQKPRRALRLLGVFLSRQRPSLPRSRPRSTIGPERLNFRVRDGNGCDPLGTATGNLLNWKSQFQISNLKFGVLDNSILMGKATSAQICNELHNCDYDQASRPISTGKLKRLPSLHVPPINVVVFHGSLGSCDREI